jgi:hypothetical protein
MAAKNIILLKGARLVSVPNLNTCVVMFLFFGRFGVNSNASEDMDNGG